MSKALGCILACLAVVGLLAEPVVADQLKRRGLQKPKKIQPIKPLSKRRNAFKSKALRILQRTNQPPVAHLKLRRTLDGVRVLPGRIDLDASDSEDADGFPELFTYELFDDDTGERLAGPLLTRNPQATLFFDGQLPRNLRATVIVEDDEGAADTTELAAPLGATMSSCTTPFFICAFDASTGETTCSVNSGVEAFTTTDLLSAAQACDTTITTSTPVLLAAAGGSGGNGSAFGISSGGDGGGGGEVRLATTLADMDTTYGSPPTTTYCYGIGGQGTHTSETSGAGGAASLLRTCQNVSQTATTGVLLIGGGGGGGGAADISEDGGFGGQGGRALSDVNGPCPGASQQCGVNQGSGFGGDGSTAEGGAGGLGGGTAQFAGTAGVGGIGGLTNGVPQAGFIAGNPQVDSGVGEGGGGTEIFIPGGGGGGYGGGSAGSVSGASGGAGGASFADTSTLSFTIPGGPGVDPGDGFLQFIFNYTNITE